MFKELILLSLIAVVTVFSNLPPNVTPPNHDWPVVDEEITPTHWEDQAKARFKEACTKFTSLKSKKAAKNIIFFLGDGMGLPTIAASRFYISSRQGISGTATQHPFENWPFNTMATTYDLETMVTDSASSATAYLTGTKARTGTIGVTGKVGYKHCGVINTADYTHSALSEAKKKGKATGVITTTTVTHASPAGNYAHVSYRGFENDAEVNKDCPNGKASCVDIACQLIEENSIDVVMGGGQKNFYPKDSDLPSKPGSKGERLDGKNLVTDWTTKHPEGKYISTPSELESLDTSEFKPVLALTYPSHMPYTNDLKGEPGLNVYTRKAIEILSQKPEGFFLFVEGGRIDHAHHDNSARYAMDEMMEFDRAIEEAVTWANASPERAAETLMIVTADHSHSFELVGQPSRFRDPSGLEHYYSLKLADKKPMTGWNYMNGPNGLKDESRADPLYADTKVFKYKQASLVPLGWATHGGDDVGVYATGPFSHLFYRTVDNTFIAQAMKFAIGGAPYDNETPCQPFLS